MSDELLKFLEASDGFLEFLEIPNNFMETSKISDGFMKISKTHSFNCDYKFKQRTNNSCSNKAKWMDLMLGEFRCNRHKGIC